MNRDALARILNRASATAVSQPTGATSKLPGDSCGIRDPLIDILNTSMKDLTAPLEVASSVLGERIWLVADDKQAATVRARGGTPYTPEEVAILRELAAAVPPELWADRLKLIHQAKRDFQGRLRL